MNEQRETRRIGAVLVGAALILGSAAPSVLAQTVDIDQLYRILSGETIDETIDEKAIVLEDTTVRVFDEGDADRGFVGDFTEEFHLERCVLRPYQPSTGLNRNVYFSLQPCYQLYLAGIEIEFDGKVEIELFVEVFITVLREFFVVEFETNGKTHRFRTRIIEEKEFVDGELVEISRNYVARCLQTNDIFYFGEAVCDFEDGECVSHEGAWLVGVNGADPGLLMPSRPLLGSMYLQEDAPLVARDGAVHVNDNQFVEVPAGEFEDCIVVLDVDLLDEDEDEKIYCPNVGLVVDGDLELISFGLVSGSDCRGTPIEGGDGFVPPLPPPLGN